MRFSVLGPLEVVNDDVPVPIRNARHRAALGMLLLHANDIVSTDWLVSSLWNESPPPTARKMVHKAMAGVRTIVSEARCHGGGTPAVVASDDGYRLRTEPDLIDLPRFFHLAQKARKALLTGTTSQALFALREALAMSRGPVLVDLVDMGVSWPELHEANRMRLDMLESLFDAALSSGRHRDVVDDLASLLETDVPTERLIAQCMLALYRSGRQLDALTVYRKMRTAAVANHHRELGNTLQHLHLAILNQDSSLDNPHAVW